jgi:hypothetical protein
MTEKRLEDRYDPDTDTWSQVEVEVEEQKKDKKEVSSEKVEEEKDESWQEDYRGKQGVTIIDIDIGFGRIIEIVFKWSFAIALAIVLFWIASWFVLGILGISLL